MNLLETLETSATRELSTDLQKLLVHWERYDHGWTEEERAECRGAMLENPDEAFWKGFLDGIFWTAGVPERIQTLAGEMIAEGIWPEAEGREWLKQLPNWGPGVQMRAGRRLAKEQKELSVLRRG